MTTETAFGKAVNTLLSTQDARSATVYLNENFTIRASRTLYKGRPSKKRVEITLTAGRPNHSARQYIKALKKAKISFPVSRVHISFTRGR